VEFLFSTLKMFAAVFFNMTAVSDTWIGCTSIVTDIFEGLEYQSRKSVILATWITIIRN
jgi:hypothetical protein